MANIASFTSPPGGSDGFGPGQTPEFLDAQTTTTPGFSQTLITRVVGATETLFLRYVVVTTTKGGCFEIRDNASVIGSGRTGASQTNASFLYPVAREIASGNTLTVVFEQPAGAGSASDIEAYVMGYTT